MKRLDIYIASRVTTDDAAEDRRKILDDFYFNLEERKPKIVSINEYVSNGFLTLYIYYYNRK